MTQQIPYPPVAPPQPPRNGFGTTGFILGIVGLVTSLIPVVGVVAWPLVILGIIFSALGIARAAKGMATNKGLSIAGVVVSVLGLAVCILWVFVFNAAVDQVDKELNRTANVTYELTGDAAAVDVTYGEGTNPLSEDVPTLPWRKDVQNKGPVPGGLLTATTGPDGGTVTCKITVDGKVVDTQTGSGAFTVVACTGL
ncbi:DUF4190 domain-containing protein [Amycolatopsis suaedae]|uniref:DUF4190 domain-containing protein n=1 Tax=Amycolatopsis suaedae TaxID=2510978 RepID=A0A4Q7J5X6_9PSEU|nr:DUF4190 domain-containing protein [Amycolatopsis suaedae]RZQ62132.1 DUF4190 domain-containing protein [Amycolatopsis suaedae]